MIPDHRLATLLDQVQRHQVNECLYHNTAVVPSLYSDHQCERDRFPLRTMFELDHHTDEVWFVDFSHDGTKLATTSRDRTVIVYDTTRDFEILHKFGGHGGEVSFVSWSPDDSKLISCSHDHKARVWDIAVRSFFPRLLGETDLSFSADWTLRPDPRSRPAANLLRCLAS